MTRRRGGTAPATRRGLVSASPRPRVLASLLAVATLVGCVPGYKVAPPTENESREIAVVSVAPESSSVRLAVVGDIHQKFEEPNRENGARVAQSIREHARRQPIDGILLVGDNFDPCGVNSKSDKKWQLLRETFAVVGVPVLPVLGNHDYGNPKWRYGKLWICGEPDPSAQLGGNVPNWRFPSRNYRVRTPVAEIFMLDSTPIAAGLTQPLLGSATSAEVLTWLRRDLPTASGWRIAAGHHHILASGKERRRTAITHRRMQSLKQVLIASDADLYVSGHRHHLELIVPQRGERHPILLVSGAGGRPRPLDDVREGSPPSVFPTHPPQGHIGYAVLEITPATLSVLFYDGNGKPVSRKFEFARRNAK